MYELPEAILFDMDDTILCSGPPPEQAWYEVVARYADRLNGTGVEEVSGAIREFGVWYWSDPVRHRKGRLDLYAASRHIVRTAFERLGIDALSIADEIGDAYRAERDQCIAPFPGAIETLGHFREAGVRLALVTNGAKESQRKKIVAHKLEAFFDCVLIEGEFGAGKPEERVYLHAMERLKARPADVWMVGDNLEWEVAAPQRLGIFAIWVDHLNKGLPKNSMVRPDRVIRAISELYSPQRARRTQR